MKKAFVLQFFLAMIISIQATFAQEQNKTFTISGIVNGDIDQRVLRLVSKISSHRQDDHVFEIKNGKFFFKGDLDSPEKFKLLFGKPNQSMFSPEEYMNFFIDPGANIKIVLNTESVEASLIEGSVTEMEHRKLLYERDTVKFGSERERIKSNWILASEKKDSVELKILMEEFKQMNQEIRQWNIDYILGHSNSFVSADLLYSMQESEELQSQEVNSILEKLDSSLLSTRVVTKIRSRLKNQIGQVVTDFTLPDVEGKEISLLDTIKNKVTFIDFWWSGCKPCREENFYLKQIYQEYKSKGFEIIGVSSDRNRSSWVKAIEKDGITWINLIDPGSEVSESFYVRVWPSTFLIDSNGVIIAKNITAEELRMKLETLLK